MTSPPKRKRADSLKKKKKSNLFCPCTHWSMVKLPVTKPLKKTESYLTLPGAINCEELHFSISITVFKESSSMLPDCFFWGMGVGKDCHKSLQCLSFSTMWICSHWHHRKRSFLAPYNRQQHRSWTFTWFLVTAQDHKFLHDLWAAVQTVTTNTVLGSIAAHGHHHGPQQEHNISRMSLLLGGKGWGLSGWSMCCVQLDRKR